MSPIEALWLMLLRSKGFNRIRPQHRSIVWHKLRIETDHGSSAVEYRIKPETRNVPAVVEYRLDDLGAVPMTWQRLTPEQLAVLLRENAVVAFWVSDKLGPAALSRACAQHCSFDRDGGPESHPVPERTVGMFRLSEPITE